MDILAFLQSNRYVCELMRAPQCVIDRIVLRTISGRFERADSSCSTRVKFHSVMLILAWTYIHSYARMVYFVYIFDVSMLESTYECFSQAAILSVLPFERSSVLCSMLRRCNPLSGPQTCICCIDRYNQEVKASGNVLLYLLLGYICM